MIPATMPTPYAWENVPITTADAINPGRSSGSAPDLHPVPQRRQVEKRRHDEIKGVAAHRPADPPRRQERDHGRQATRQRDRGQERVKGPPLGADQPAARPHPRG